MLNECPSLRASARSLPTRIPADLSSCLSPNVPAKAMTVSEMKSLVREIVERVTVAADRIEIRLSQADEAGAVCGESSQHAARPRDGANTR
jgi:hypothetical protein